MNKTVVACAAILGFAAIVSVYIHTSGNRYSTANVGKGMVYRTDHKTGKIVLIDGLSETPVESVEDSAKSKSETPSERAIREAKSASTLREYPFSNEFSIRSQLEQMQGNLRVLGWDAKRINDQTYVVTYSYERDTSIHVAIHRFAFEVNLEANIVRNITGDPALERRYDIRQIQ